MNTVAIAPQITLQAMARKATGLIAAIAVALSIVAIRPLAASTFSAKADPALYRAAQAAPASTLPVIVRERTPASTEAEGIVWRLGGRVSRELPIIGSFAARVPARSLSALAEAPSVTRVWGDASIRMAGVDMNKYASWAPNTIWRASIGLDKQSYTGAGVGVAVLDTGVSPNQDLGSRLVYHASFAPDADVYDHFGHGTHMAGVIAGDGTLSNGAYQGVAPRANVVSVKVAAPDGSTDVSVVIDGLQWVYANRADYNIRVLNMSFGTDSTQGYLLDPLNYAVEQVWKKGVMVVVAAGNRGPNAGTITKPGDDPYVLTVGAVDVKGTSDRNDDVVAPFSSQGPTQDGFTKPDVVAPGITIVSDRDPGSMIDAAYPEARVGEHYFKGTGTSQATAVVSGLAALMFQANPSLTPDVAKATILGSAKNIATSGPGSGQGEVWVPGAVGAAASGTYVKTPANQLLAPSTGMGTLEGSRGSMHIYANLNGTGTLQMVTGEIGFNGTAWSGTAWSGTAWSGTAWSGTAWSGTAWSGTAWSDQAWN